MVRVRGEMGSIDYVELLRKRSQLFHEYGKEALNRGHYDISTFYAEQSLQLRLKSLALRLLGYIPRLHSVRELFGLILKYLGGVGRDEPANRLRSFIEKYRDALRLLDEAYTASRYLPKIYDCADAMRALKTVDEAIDVLDEVERDLFS